MVYNPPATRFYLGPLFKRCADKEPVVVFSCILGTVGLLFPIVVIPIRNSLGYSTWNYDKEHPQNRRLADETIGTEAKWKGNMCFPSQSTLLYLSASTLIIIIWNVHKLKSNFYFLDQEKQRIILSLLVRCAKGWSASMGFNLLYAVLVPSICFSVIVAYHLYEFRYPSGKTRSTFKLVREGWVDENFLKGQSAVNTTRDYIRIALFFGNTAIIISGFITAFSASQYASCSSSAGGCSDYNILLFVKLGILVAVMLSIFFIFSQCSRFANHFSFMINTRAVNEVPFPTTVVKRMFHRSHFFYSIGIRMYFFTIPIFAWLFNEWCLIVATPLYLLLTHGLETSGFMDDELKEFEAALRTKEKEKESYDCIN